MAGEHITDVILGHAAAIIKIEPLDLKVDGSPTVDVIITPGTFDMIARVVLSLRFATASIDWGKFGNDIVLTNGWYMFCDDQNLGEDFPIKDNGDFFNVGYDVSIEKDAAGTPNQILSARWSFNRMSPWGLGVWDGETFGFRIQDDITLLTSIDSFEAFVEGWVAHP